MDYFLRYDGNVHPDEWIKDIQKYYSFWSNDEILNVAILLVDTFIIKLPSEINDHDELRDALKKDITFTVFKDSNRRKLQSLKYISEKDGGNTLKFLSDFRKLCYNSEINNIEEQKEHFYNTLINCHHFLTEFYKRMNNINSMDELIKEFDEIVMDELNIIRNGSIIALRNVATGKYLTSIEDLNYTTGSKNQLVFTGDSKFDPNALWYIYDTSQSTNKDNYIFTKSDINFKHKISGQQLGICHYCNVIQVQVQVQNQNQNQIFQGQFGQNPYENLNPNQYQYQYQYQNQNQTQHQNQNRIQYNIQYKYHTSPTSNHTEVSCINDEEIKWKLIHSRMENNQGYLRSNDVVNISIKKLYDINGPIQDGQVEFLRNHDIQFTIGNDTFQEVVCHNERLGGIDKWCIELIKKL
ncbi:hypothetical protein RclHR1_17580002 [Rhizophagus clarus]|uniref:MIR domain-containing protein n=1 Tax=Rhizophagus clarus TaxID=94130 RepID=A0A2Z6R0T6_9GLOM|nr:hypothetical protein RclHR1_17580002 [Rhizophagus clarus]GES94938.1 hypothetical protein GLOIN_2v1837320 [Rhizophagus clarus]